MRVYTRRFISFLLVILMTFQTPGTLEVFAETIKNLPVVNEDNEKNSEEDIIISEDIESEVIDNSNESQEDLQEPNVEENNDIIEEESIQDIEKNDRNSTNTILRDMPKRDFIDYELDTNGFSGEAMVLLNKGNYNTLTAEEQDILLMEVAVRNDTMSVLADNGYTIMNSVPIARIMQQLDISLDDALTMIQNQGGLGNAVYEANELRVISISNPILFNEAESIKKMTLLMVAGFTYEEAINAYVMSLALDMDLSEIAVLNSNLRVEDIVIPYDKLLIDDQKEILEEVTPQFNNEAEFEDADLENDEENQEDIIESETVNVENYNINNEIEIYGDYENNKEINIEEDFEENIIPSEDQDEGSQEIKDTIHDETDVIKDVIDKEDESHNEKVEYKISEDDIVLIFDLAKTYNISPSLLVNFILEKEIYIENLRNNIDVIKDLYTLKNVKSSANQRASSSIIPGVSWYSPENGMFNYKGNSNDTININTGSLIYNENIVNLKGKSGLDLDVSFIYNSSEATQDQTYGVVHTMSLYTGRYSDSGRPYEDEFTDEIYDLPASYRHNEKTPPVTEIAAGWRLNTTHISYKVFIYNHSQSITEFTLNLSNGKSYLLELGSDFKYKIKDNKLNDIKFERDTYATYPGADYVVKYADGVQEYIAVKNDSSIVAKRDKFNNVIKYSYLGDSTNGRITITDTMGRVVTISVNNSSVNVDLPDNKKINFERKVYKKYDAAFMQLVTKTDQLGRKTSFTYDTPQIEFDYFSQTRRSKVNIGEFGTRVLWYNGMTMALNTKDYIGKFLFANYYDSYSQLFGIHMNDYKEASDTNLVGERTNDIYASNHMYHNLTKVVYPTGAYTAYSYSKGQKRLGPLGNSDYFMVTNRYEYTNGSKYNETTYKYGKNGKSTNNFCYYDLGKLNGSEDLDNYRYYVEESRGNNKTTYIFNKKHQLLDKTVESGNMQINTKTDYTDTGLPLSVAKTVKQGAKSHTTKELFEYNNYGNITAHWSPLAEGNKSNTEYKTSFTYDPSYQMLTSKTYKQDSSKTIKETFTLDSTKKYVTRHEVSLNGAIQKQAEYEVNSNGMVTKVKKYITPSEFIPENYTYKNNVYLASTEVNSVKQSFSYDTMGNLTEQVDRNGNSTKFTYDAIGRLLTTTKPDKSTTSNSYNDSKNIMTTTDELGNKFKYTYDGLGHILKSEDLTSGKSIGEVSYDERYNISRDIDANGIISKYKYDNLGRVTELNKEGYIEEYIYDDAFDNMGSKETKIIKGDINAPDIKSSVYTDKFGNKLYETGHLGNQEIKTSYKYDYLGNVLSFLNPEDAKQGREYTNKYEYNIYSDPIETTDAFGYTTTSKYDLLGRKISSTDAKKNIFEYKYDIFGNIIEEVLPFDGSYKSVQKYTYDNNGNVLTSSVAVNKPGEALKEIITINEYDNLNQLIKSKTGDSYTEYVYDKKGNQIELKTAGGTQIIKYEYDHFNRLTKTIDALEKEETYTYDNMGKPLSKTDRNGNITHNRYDNLGNLVEVTVDGPDGKSNEYLKYTYCKNNLLLKEENENLISNYLYDGLGRTISVNESNGIKKDYLYNLNGNITEFTLSLKGSAKSKLSYEYDKLNRLIKVNGTGKEEVFYSYDENGNRSYMKLGNGVETEYIYNDANLIKSLKNKSGGTLLSSYSYTYFLDGNQESKTENNDLKTTYIYDDLRRLKEESQIGTDKNTTWNYEYDQAYNRSKMTISRNGETEVTDYSYDKNNRLLKEIRVNSSIGEQKLSSYSYDDNGNQLMKMTDVIAPINLSSDVSLRIYILGFAGGNSDKNTGSDKDKIGLLELNTYDVFNRLRTTKQEGTTLEYGYRADGLRILKTVNGKTTIQVWDGSNIVADLDSSLEVKDIYIRGINLINSEENGYYIYNAHGDVVQLSDSDGHVIKEYSYDAFGVEEDIDEEDVNPFRYSAEYFDKETGRIYLRARYYIPSLGRFMSEDPIRDGLNWYTYCLNNPIRFIDPTGLSSMTYIGAESAKILGIKSDYYSSDSPQAIWWKLMNGYNVGAMKIPKNQPWWSSISKNESGSMIFKGEDWLALAEGSYPYIYSTKDETHSVWTGGFDASADLTFGTGHSIKSEIEFLELKNFIATNSSAQIASKVKSILSDDLNIAVSSINRFIQDNNINLKQHQFDAMVSLVFNVPIALSKDSDLAKALIANDFSQSTIVEAFTFTKFQGKRIDGLVTRRNNELNLFFTGNYSVYYDSKQKVIDSGAAYINYQ